MLGFSSIAANAIGAVGVVQVLPAPALPIGTLAQTVQQPDLGGGYVELFDLDATGIGGAFYRFTPTISATYSLVTWQGNVYSPIPIQALGFEWTTVGAQPRPTLTLGNVGQLLMAAVNQFGDLVGAKLTRWRTLSQYLDDGDQADPTAHFPPDAYYVEEKTSQDATQITWTLSSIIDRPFIMLPRRQVLRDDVNGMPGFPGVSRIRMP